MSDNRYCILSLLGIFGIPLCLAILVFVIDPYYQYRQPFYGFVRLRADDDKRDMQRVMNPGRAKTGQFNAIVTGTSTAQYLDCQEVDEAFGVQSIKLTFHGATTYEWCTIAELAFKNQDLDLVICSLDPAKSFCRLPNTVNGEFPAELYRTNPANAYDYFLGYDYVRACIYAIAGAIKEQYISPNQLEDTLYGWSYSEQDVISIYKKHRKAPLARLSFPDYPSGLLELMKENFRENVEPLIDNHKSTQFIFFFPCYSMCEYATYAEGNYWDDYLAFKRWAFEKLLAKPNVTVFDFQVNREDSWNLEQYSDTVHLLPALNSKYVGYLKDGTFKVTKENTAKYIAHLRRQLEEFQETLPSLLEKYEHE